MSANANWARWVFASISKHFDDRRGNLPLYIEGQHRATRDQKDYLELRMDGPNIREVSRGFYLLRVEVNILISCVMDDSSYHRIHQNAGSMQAAFTDIPVYRYGNGPDDDQSYVGCLRLLQDWRNTLELNHFGRVGLGDALVQATVEGHYQMQLYSNE